MKKQLESKYNHQLVEQNKYQFWLDQQLFKADPNSKKPKFSIILPPPNVTGKLHIGHAWDTSLQDAIIRFKKITGYDTLYLPGMDHSGISTQVKVEAKLKEQNIDKHKLGREQFLKEAWKWKEEYASVIRSQWAKLGLSLDYSIEKFTLDADVNDVVNEIFVKFYNEKIIYKGKQIVNWDPIQQTAISNIEVIYRETESKMYYFKYLIKDSDDYLIVATTRPETMFADQCLVVNPNDDRYKKYLNKQVINPVNNQIIPVIGDEYVDSEFGTGVMKCTPAHDANDFELAVKYNLEMIICLNPDATVNHLGGELYAGLDRFVAREKIVEIAKQNNLLVKEEKITHQVGYSERSNAIVEPYLSDQWFVKMQKFNKMILDLQASSNKINFFPERFNDVLVKWMQNANDWCISRQLWWGHQIPCWYHKQTKQLYVSKQPPQDIENWVQDADVLDTWFSSGLWAFSTLMNGQGFTSEYFKNYFPSNVLVTGYDIIFFWVARMIFQTLEYTKQIPFKDVLIHGLVRDQENRKMSKSLGNGIDPMDIIEQNGADALRLFLLTNSTPGQDIRFSNSKIAACWNFINKLWNASRYVFINLEDDFLFDPEFYKNELDVASQWILTELSEVQSYVYDKMNKYEFGLAGTRLFEFVWDKFCSWYIEFAKINLKNQLANQTKQTLFYLLKEILIMLHSYIPFVTEEIYQTMNLKASIMLEQWTILNLKYETSYISDVINMITSLREFRNTNKIKNSLVLKVLISNTNQKHTDSFKQHKDQIASFLKKFTNTLLVDDLDSTNKTSLSIQEYFLDIANDSFTDKKQLIKELEFKISELDKEILRSKKILNNSDFINKAKPEKIAQEKNKYQSYQEQLKAIKTKLDSLK
ncbi:valine--tRNA ligase [Mycoplasma putrefaciens]|uniref:Valine--tRNA ligase n=1 Tax=Mycoplasma putrefaciens (strain ATCC 15718 / NCTC 10155 / C30 KS-1 / KS-1) TaxID=743965 RepID=A0A7U3ZSM9_MYCPK|nr:valine--tRNA ligase [Mycoplasma putrefaciens]AEM68797.1 valyl-tRNA synthetase [Mycoplasma putrefaciens KS1]